MKIVRSLLLVVFLAPALVVVGASSALACSCVPPQPDNPALKEAAAVFTGTVVDTEDGVDIGFDEVTWTFAVDTVYKGEVAATQEVETHTQSAACGVVFKEQKRYVVFAHKGGPGEPVSSARDVLATNSCMNTRAFGPNEKLEVEPIAEYEEFEALGPEDRSPGDDALPLGIVIAAAGIAALAFSGAMVLLIRRGKDRRRAA